MGFKWCYIKNDFEKMLRSLGNLKAFDKLCDLLGLSWRLLF